MESPESLIGRLTKCPKCGQRQKVKKPSSLQWISLRGEVIQATDKAILFRDAASGHELWFPQSMSDEEPGGVRVPKQWYEEKLADIAKGAAGDQYKRWFARRRELTMVTFQWVVSNAGFPGEPLFAGFTISVGGQCTQARLYDKAFLPLQVARKAPELLPPYEGICMPDTCECEFKEVSVDEMMSPQTHMIVGERQVVTIGQWRERQGRSADLPAASAQLQQDVILAVQAEAESLVQRKAAPENKGVKGLMSRLRQVWSR
jgi:hypothetical protein